MLNKIKNSKKLQTIHESLNENYIEDKHLKESDDILIEQEHQNNENDIHENKENQENNKEKETQEQKNKENDIPENDIPENDIPENDIPENDIPENQENETQEQKNTLENDDDKLVNEFYRKMDMEIYNDKLDSDEEE
jgi:hypothetical protein